MTRDKFKAQLGQRIIQLRTKKGWTQADLARAVEKSPQAIEKIENGRVNPTAYTLFEIAEALKVPLTELVNF